MRDPARVALVTCAELPDLDPDDRLVAQALRAAGVVVDAVVWDDPAVAWAGYDLSVLRSSWDYPPRRDEFVAWARSVPRLANPAAVVAWNTDKRYLAALSATGVSTVPTQWIGPTSAVELPPEGEWVIKPAVGAGSLDTGRYNLADRAQRGLAVAHVARLQAAGRRVMLQPYLSAVDSDGETALLFLGGAYSHAIRKGPMLTGPAVEVDGLYQPEEIRPREPSPAQLALAEQALAAVPGDALLYARVDLVPGPDGHPVLLELELAEPSLFLGTSAPAAQRFAEAILARVSVG
jgi:hypothetical protein